MIELTQTDLPEPVVPAISIWGIAAMSPMVICPAMSRPKAAGRAPLALRNSSESMTSRMVTVSVTRLGTSMPTAGLLGIGASIRTPAVARFKAMSSARPVILLILTPVEGCSSYRVTVGPRVMSTIRVWTPKDLRVSTSLEAFCFNSSLTSSLRGLWGSFKRLTGGRR